MSLDLFGGLTLSVRVLSSGFGLLEVQVEVSPPTFPVLACLALAFFSFRLVNPDSFLFAGWSLPTPEARCYRSSSFFAGVLELLASCSGVSVLTPEIRVLDIIPTRFLTTGSSLPLAEISTSDSLDGALELPAHTEEFLVGISLEGSPVDLFSFCRFPFAVPRVLGI
jgi:hypothetical protein